MEFNQHEFVASWIQLRYIVSQPEGMEGPVKIIKDEIEKTNFETVKSWISLCQNKHTKICSIEDPSFVPRP
jgi:hypothetical protein